MKEIIKYIVGHKFLNSIAVFAIFIIVSFQVSKYWNTPFGINGEIVNYYYEIFVGLSVSYLVSVMFYIIVVYNPERRKKHLINVKTSRVFARLQTYLRNFIYSVVEAYNIELKATDDIRKDYINKINNTDPLKIMGKCHNHDPINENDTMLKKAINSSIEIEKLKRNLIPFLVYLEDEELNFYAELEDILIFENMNKLDIFPPKDQLLIDDLPYIFDVYYSCKKIVGANSNKIEWQPEYKN